jgi:hypothetical protein
VSDAPSLPTVVYLAGYGRSGSTVLDLLLGASGGAVAVGELFMFFRPDETQGCSCGKPVGECPFWRDVRAKYEELLGEKDAAQDLGLAFRSRVEGLFAPLAGLFAGKLRGEYARHQRALVQAIAEVKGPVSGQPRVVDSSKTAVEVAWRPAALARCGLSVKMIHLVRDGRGVMNSVLRGCNRKLERGDADPSLSFPQLRSVIGWSLANFAAWVQGWRLGPGNTLRVSYEDLTADPAGELSRIGAFLGLDLAAVIERLARREVIPPAHSISGNRLRHTGVVEVREDDAWRTELPFSARLVYWLFGWPAHLLFVRRRTRGPIASLPRTSTPGVTSTSTRA